MECHVFRKIKNQNGEKRQMSRRFVLCMGTALLLGILVVAKEPLWMLAVGLAVLMAANYNRKYLFTQKIVRSMVLLAFFCLGAGFFVHSQQSFREIQRIPEESNIVLQGQIYKKEKKGEQYLYYLRKGMIWETGTEKEVTVSDDESGNGICVGNLILKTKTDVGSMGMVIQAKSNMRWMEQASNEGAFDERNYYHSLGIATVLYADDIKVAECHVWLMREKIYQLRNRISAYYQSMLTESDAGILSAMVLGDKSWMEPETKQLYTNAGISHILAVSGLHISVIGMGIYRLLRKLTVGLKGSALVSGGCVLLFCMLSGLSVSALRAGGMFMIFLMAQVMGRKYDTFCGLACVGMISLLWNPYLLWNAAFLFSYMAVLGAAGFGRMKWRVTETEKPDFTIFSVCSKQILSRLWGSCAVLLTTLPLTAYFYYQIPLYSIPANLLVLPFTGVLLSTGVAGGMAGALGMPFSWLLLVPGHWILQFFQMVCNVLLKLPLSGVWITGQPERWMLGIYFSALHLAGFFWQRNIKKYATYAETNTNRLDVKRKTGIPGLDVKGKKSIFELKVRMMESNAKRRMIPCGVEAEKFPEKIRLFTKNRMLIWEMKDLIKQELLKHMGQFVLLGAVIFLTGIFLHPPAKQFRMDFLDMGQGDGIFLNNGNGTTFFVDGGSVSESAVGTYEILPFLKYHRVRAIDYWIVSHGDEDHISGLEEILSSGYKVRNLLISGGMPHDNAWWKLMQLAKEQDIEVIEVDTGAYLLAGDMRISFYADADQNVNSESENGNGALKITEVAKDRNERSLAMLAEYKTARMLLAGDMGSAQEEWLAEQPGISGQSLDVLKASHHGSKNSSSEQFLQAMHPEYTVISCGKKNRYGHPHEEALQRMKDAGTEIHKTMEEGQVTVTLKEGKIQINKHK